ncbi:MAG TPA: TIGR02281 family clan AA aspartic protease [Allosphingosinicella sp.]|jgi:aspartyl protease family protein
MQKALFFTVAAGIALGLMWPTGPQSAAPAPAPAAVTAAAGELKETVLERSEAGHFYANVEVNGQLVRFLVDTGATGVSLTERDARRIGIALDPGSYETVGMGAGGPVRGQRVKLDSVVLDGKAVRGLEGAVLEGGDMNLLGQDYLNHFSVEMRRGTMRIS